MSDRIDNQNLVMSGLNLTIGPDDALQNCQLQRCRVTFAKPNGQWVSDNVFTDCDIHVEGRYTKVWLACQFIRCRFTGTYYNTDIGVMKDGQCDLTDRLVDCDFSKAKMHFVRLNNCNSTGMKFPGWPHVTVIDAKSACAALSVSSDEYSRYLSFHWVGYADHPYVIVWNLEMCLPSAQKHVNNMISIKHMSDQPEPVYPILNLERTRAVFENCPGVII